MTTAAAAEPAAAAGGQSASDQKPAEQKPAEQKPAEQKPADDKPAGDKPAEETPAAAAPVTYALKAPEGDYVGADDLAAIEALARRDGWTNEEAQAVVEERVKGVQAQAAQFLESTKADPIYGGAAFESTLKHFDAALDKLRPAGTPRGDAFRALLHRSGYGNNLEVVSLFADLGKLMAEDNTTGGITSGNSAPQVDLAHALYPNMK